MKLANRYRNPLDIKLLVECEKLLKKAVNGAAGGYPNFQDPTDKSLYNSNGKKIGDEKEMLRLFDF